MTRMQKAAVTVVAVSVLLICCSWRTEKLPDFSVVGAASIATLTVAVAYLVAREWGSGPLALIAKLALFVGLVVTLPAVVGAVVRWQAPDAYAMVAGDKTSVTLGAECAIISLDNGTIEKADHSECPGSTWQVDGHDVTGTVYVDWTAYDDGRPPEHLDAYTLDGKAYSVPPKQRQTTLAYWGHVPLWTLWLGLVVTVVGVVLAFAPRRR